MADALTDHPMNMPKLFEAIGAAWEHLNGTLDGINERDAIQVVDANGWNARDHVTHLTAWERSTLYLLERRPRHEALGISEDVLQSGDVDAVNEVIRSQNADVTWGDARGRLSDVHAELVSTVQTLTWDDIQHPYSSYLPDKTGEEGEWPVGIWVYSNASLHFDDHRKWIEELLAPAR